MASFWQRLPLSAKIFLPYFILLVLVGTAGTYVAGGLAARTTNDRLATALVEAARDGDAALARLEGARLAGLQELAARPALGTALLARDQAAIAAALRPPPDRAALAAVVLPDGTVIGDSRSLAGSPAVGAALGGADSPRQAIVAEAANAWLIAAAPLRDERGVVAVLVVGQDAAAIVDDLRRATLADAALYAPDGHSLASTLAPAAEASPDAGPTVNSRADAALPIVPPTEDLRLTDLTRNDRSYRMLVAPLRAGGSTIGSYAVAMPSDVLSRVGEDTRSRLATLFGGAMALSVLLGLTIARSIAGPVRTLAEAARAVGAGDLSRRAGLRGRDEIASLGGAFDAMAANLDHRQRELAESYLRTVRALAAAVDAKDPYTHGHSQRVSAYCVATARQLGLESAIVDEIEMGGLLHDVGKIGTPDEVLTKPGKLNDEEWALIKRHPEAGAEILRPVGFSPRVMNLVLYHHERLHGRGFPRGLRGDEIPLEARIAAVCDAYDAMTSDRSYRRSLGRDGAIAELLRGAGDQFDPACVEAFIAVLPDDEPPADDESAGPLVATSASPGAPEGA